MMQVTCGADWITPTDNTRSYAITLDENDLALKLGEDKVAEMDFNTKVKALNNLADAYVVGYITKNGGMSKAYAERRLQELADG